MENEILKEIQFLREGLSTFAKRLDQLESQIRASAGAAPAPRPLAVPPSPPPPKAAPAPSAPPKAAPPQPARRKEALETRIGRDWLNRIGVASLVFGVAFFILYSFQYLGAGAKIAIGLACAASLIGGGVVLERRTGWRWYAVGLIGGGWALLYFTTYAMHHIQAVRILESRLLDLLLLAAVAAGAVRHSLAYRSSTITALAFLLGFITISVSPVTYFTLSASVLLIVSVAIVAVRMRWHDLVLFGVVASCLTHAMSLAPQIAASPIIAIHTASAASSQFWLTAGFLALYWLTYIGAVFFLDEGTRNRRNALLTATLVNGGFFAIQLLEAMEPVYRAQRYLVLLALGACYLGLGQACRRRLPATSSAAILIGITMATLAIPLRLTDRWTSFWWTVEVGALAWLGLRHDRWTYRLFAFGLGVAVLCRLLWVDLFNSFTFRVVLGPWSMAVSWRLLIGLVGVVSFSAAAAAYQHAQYRSTHRSIEGQAFHLYAIAASVIAWMLTGIEAERNLLGLLWAIEASGVVLLGWRLPDRGIRMIGLLWFGTAALQVLWLCTERSPWAHATAVYGVIGLLYGASLLYRQALPGRSFTIERRTRHIYNVAATVLLTMSIWNDVARQWLSPAWAVEGLLLVASGFALKDRVLRISGLAVFALMLCRVLLVDLAGVETIYRILSFLAVGAMLLVASFAYTKFSTGKPQPGTAEPGETNA